MRSACFVENLIFAAGKWQVSTRNSLVSTDMRQYLLLDTQEVTDSSSVEPTTLTFLPANYSGRFLTEAIAFAPLASWLHFS